MKASWKYGLSDDEAKELELDFKSAKGVRERLVAMLKDKMEDQLKFSRGKDQYSTPNWSHLQADTCGYNRCLADIISLIE